MVVFRIVLIIALVSSNAVLSMQSMYKQNMTINDVLNAVLCPTYYFDSVELVKVYLKNGGDINARGTLYVQPQPMKKMNLLMVSALFGYAKLMKFLLKKDVRLNCQSELGNTALMMAAINGRAGLVSLLLDAGASPLARNHKFGDVTALW